MSKKYHLTVYGCAMNTSDSQRVAFVLEKIGFQQTQNQNEADLAVFTMCSIRQSAVDRLFSAGQKIKKQNPKCKLLLTGCIVKNDLSRFKDTFDYILPIKSLKKWPKILNLDKHFGFDNEKRMQENADLNISYLKTKPKYSQNFSVSIPISYGCDNFCTYCVVPYTRGPLICRDFNDIVKETKQAIKNGAKEIWLLGQNVNDYKSKVKSQNSKGKSKSSKLESIKTFSDLMREVNDITGEFWIRFTSPHPAQVNDDFIKTLAQCKKFAPYLNFPVQSGDNEILRAMNRPYTREEYLLLIKKMRQAFRKYRQGDEKILAISTDIIVGFPNETKKQFENTKKIVNQAGFMLGYISQYSARKGTPAAKNDNIKTFVKKSRWKEINAHLAKEVLKFNKQFVDKTTDVLVFEKQTKNGVNKYFGKTKHYITVVFESQKQNLVGQMLPIKIVKANSWILEGSLIKSKIQISNFK